MLTERGTRRRVLQQERTPASNTKRTGPTNVTKRKRRTFRGTKRSGPRLAALVFVAFGFLLPVLWLCSSDTTRESLRHKLPSKKEEVNPPGTCIIDEDRMPDSWKPPNDVKESLDWTRPWGVEEQAIAVFAAEEGLDELIDYIGNLTDDRIRKLNTDAVNAMIDEVAGGRDKEFPIFNEKAITATVRVLKISTQEYVDPDDQYKGCEAVYEKMKFLAYTHYLSNILPDNDELKSIRKVLIERLNETFEKCGTLEEVIAENVMEAITNTTGVNDDIFSAIMNAIALVDCKTIPEVQLPKGSENFITDVWTYMGKLDFPYATKAENGYNDKLTKLFSWTVTHAGYIPTGYGRHIQLVKDAPWLQTYVRENFYACIQHGDLDLVAEFVDIFRQFGCTENDDLQLRYGSRWLLNAFKKNGNSWMGPHEMPTGDDDRVTERDYFLIHKPWTGISGVSGLDFEPIVPGSYGYAFQQALGEGGYKGVDGE